MFDLDRLRSCTHFGGMEFHAEILSTNTLALSRAGEVGLKLPHLILAGRQTAGRGRGANAWWSDDGSATFSLILGPEEYGLAPAAWPAVALTASVAVCDAVAAIAGHVGCGVKWPNDVYVDGKKLGGILVEIPPGRPARLVVGVGLNINTRLEHAPAELRLRAASLREAAAAEIDATGFLMEWAERFHERTTQLAARDGTLPTRWQSLCLLKGRTITVASGSQTLTGRCLGIAEDGTLRLERPEGERRLVSGTVRW